MADPKAADLDVLDREEALDPRLRAYMHKLPGIGNCIQHPLYYSLMHHDSLNALANAALKQKTEAVEESRRDGRWSRFVMLHERPWRFQALREIEDSLSDIEYWELVGHFWTDSENIWQNEDEWIEVLTADRPSPERIMDDDDRAALAAMPSRLTVFRGFHRDERERGLSWTVDRERAEWFAQRYQQDGARIVEETVSRKAVIAFFNGRNEQEIVALPWDVSEGGDVITVDP